MSRGVFKRFAAAVFLALILAACGQGGSSSKADDSSNDDNGGGEQEQPVHSVPQWLIGTWQVVRIRFGNNVEPYGLYLTVGESSFEYHYPECDVEGTLVMEPSLPMHAANEYTMTMTWADCDRQWDIPTYAGSEDMGEIWSDDGGRGFFRMSWYYDVLWIYHRTE
ncbi:MAG: hypothetical protein ACNS63_08415 [Candidatus Nitrospinota bacterium M3_3B_026]